MDGLVLAVGDAGERAAEVVAERRGWRLTHVRDFDEAAARLATATTGAALIVAEMKALEVRPLLDLARDLAERAPDLCLGYLYGRSGVQLEEAAAALLRGTEDAPADGVVRLFNMLSARHPLQGANLLEAHQSSADKTEVIRLFKQRSALDILVGHSNGCDMGLGGVLLCRHDDVQSASAEELRVMPCYHGGPCSRHAANKGIVTSSDAAGARRVAAACCWGVTMARGPFAAEYSIGESLLLHAGVAALLGTVRAASFETPELTLLYHACAAGLPFAAVANRLNRYRLRAGLEAEWVCFGDPVTSVACTSVVVPVDVDASDGVSTSVRLTAPPGPIDLRAFLSGDCVPEEPIVLTHDAGETIAGALSPDGTICLTMNGATAQDVRLQIVDRRHLARSTGVEPDFAADLEFLDVYLHGPLRELQPSSVKTAVESLAAVRRVFWGWSLGSVPLGAILRYEAVAAELAALDDAVDTLADHLLDVVDAYVRRAGCMHTHLWVWAYRQAPGSADAGRCTFCGASISETTMVPKQGSAARRVGFCDGCGFVYDGDPSWGSDLAAPIVVSPGAVCEMSLRIRNGARASRRVRALGVFDRHETGASVIARQDFGVLEPGEERTCHVDVEIPANAAAGVNYLGMAVMMGPKLNCYQRVVLVKR